MRAVHCWRDHRGYMQLQMWQQWLLSCCVSFCALKRQREACGWWKRIRQLQSCVNQVSMWKSNVHVKNLIFGLFYLLSTCRLLLQRYFHDPTDVYCLPGMVESLPALKPISKSDISTYCATTLCSSSSLDIRQDYCGSCGKLGRSLWKFKCWLNRGGTLNHSGKKIDICEITKIPLKMYPAAE